MREREAAGSWPAGTVRFAVFGDQRALADGESEELMGEIARRDREEAIDFIVDLGDIVWDGRNSDQFALLNQILAPLRHRPYIVAVGNHEVHDNKSVSAREHTLRFLSSIDSTLSFDRLYYRKDFGPVTLLLLDSNDLVYGTQGRRAACPPTVSPESREGRQLAWLKHELVDLAAHPVPTVIVAMHHPFLQSSKKHRQAAPSLWNLRDAEGATLEDLFAGAGVDVVLAGHTHTYERFVATRNDGRTFHFVNASGRPRNRLLWVGASERRARDIRGREGAWLAQNGWRHLENWKIEQFDPMLEEHEADQFALFTVTPDGSIEMELSFLDAEAPGGIRREAPIQLR